MKRIVVSIVTISILALIFFNDNEDNRRMFPQPLDTYVNEYHLKHEGKRKGQRQEWIHRVHGGDASNWEAIEYRNTKTLSKIKKQRRKENNIRGGIEEFANGKVSGEWIERGSINQAGNVRITAYDKKEETIYCIGGGGPMLKSDLVGSNWEVINDDYRFNGSFLEVIDLGGDNPRILAAIQGIPHYSDDGGVSWIPCSGLATVGATIYNAMYHEGKVFLIYKNDYWSPFRLFVSEDNGESYTNKKGFIPYQNGHVNFQKAIGSDDVLLVEKITEGSMNVYLWNNETNKLDRVAQNSPFNFEEGDCRGLSVVKNDTTHTVYMLDGNSKHYLSHDYGKNWEFVGNLPSSPWAVGVYRAPSDPEKLIYGEVDSYRSSDGGSHWENINRWWEYYNDPFSKLHADIMDIAEYEYDDEESFILIGNHGGLSYSKDHGVTNLNIGLEGLNVGQFYDVVTDPNDPYYIYGGTQDQGLQRGEVLEEGTPSYLEQNISGDYGHLVFTNQGKHLWTVYPGGWIGVYEDPRNESSPTASYTIDSGNETVWIPPIIPSPYGDDVVYAAGGSTNPSSFGSHIIRLENLGFSIQADELPFDFSVSGGTISAMAVSPFDNNVWYVLTTNGHYYYSNDGGQNFEMRQQFLSDSHYLYGSCILPSKTDPNVIYISGSGYSHAPVYKSDNAGLSFSPMDQGMMPTTCFKLASNSDESLIFAATESGPYVFVVEDNQWHSLTGNATPNQTYWSVEFVSATNTARFGTYGRGIWDFDVRESVSTEEEYISSDRFQIYPNPASEYFNIKPNEDIFSDVSEVQILDNMGRLVYTESINSISKTHRVELEGLRDGLYHVVIRTEAVNYTNRLTIVRR